LRKSEGLALVEALRTKSFEAGPAAARFVYRGVADDLTLLVEFSTGEEQLDMLVLSELSRVRSGVALIPVDLESAEIAVLDGTSQRAAQAAAGEALAMIGRAVFGPDPHAQVNSLTAALYRAMLSDLQTTDQFDTFENAYAHWQQHDCDSLSDVCTCSYAFPCTECGTRVFICGEEMPAHADRGARCEWCFYGISDEPIQDVQGDRAGT